METRFLKEALFAGMTSNAFKLGTVLTFGWFWPRISGYSVLYRGESMEQIDFEEILTVAELDAEQINPPAYVSHDAGSTYFYVVRRVNGCGDQEYTLVAAAKVVIDEDGGLIKWQPNNIFKVKVTQIADSKVELIWFYNPIGQKSNLACFNIYFDDGSGQIDYENPIARIDYKTRKFYGFISKSLSAGKYLFAIKVEDIFGIENTSFAQVKVEVNVTNATVVDIADIKAL
jgi:hypothetical protein